jgi:hypothetical protein
MSLEQSYVAAANRKLVANLIPLPSIDNYHNGHILITGLHIACLEFSGNRNGDLTDWPSLWQLPQSHQTP